MSTAQGGATAAPMDNAALSVGSEGINDSQVESHDSDTTEEVESNSVQTQAEIKRLNKLKLKVHGEEIEEELPFEIEEDPEVVEYLTKNLQLGKAAQRAMQEKATYEQQVKHFFQGMKTNTREYLMQMGIDPKEFAAQVIEEEIKKAQLTPEQLQAMELQEELKKEKEARQREKEEYERQEFERIQQIEYERIDNQMSEALESSDLPKTPYVVRKMAEYMLAASKRGIDLSAKDVLPVVREELLGDLKTIINSLGEDAAEEFIGKEVLTRFRKKNIAKAKTNPVTPATAKASIKEVANNSGKMPQKSMDKVDYKKFFGF
jgi:hypothetical protein